MERLLLLLLVVVVVKGRESLATLVLALIALPGYFVAVGCIQRLGPKTIQLQVCVRERRRGGG